MNKMTLYWRVSLLFSLIVVSIEAQSFKEMVTSDEDGAVDLSDFLNSRTGFLPVPIIITEPAVGYGAGAVLAYFHKKKGADNKRKKGLSPTISFGGGAYTSNETWLVLAGHQGSYLKDRIRYLGVVSYVSANLTFFGAGILNEEREYTFNIKGFLTMHELLFRPKKDIPFFTGLNYTYFGNEISFKDANIPEFEKLTSNTSTAGLNAVLLWDSRNNSMTPTKGIRSFMEIGANSEAFGGDSDYGNFNSRSYFYAPIGKGKLFPGYRLVFESKWGDVPFYELPFISLRGIQALRYQDHHVYTLETEWRWNFIKRWSLVGFVGAGEAFDDYNDMFQNVKVAGGGGFRYFLAKQYGLHAGIDIARGPEIWTWNITIGSNWAR